MREHAIASAEVIDGEPNARLFETGQRDTGGLDVLNHRAFGDLKANRAPLQAEFPQHVRHGIDEAI